MKEGKRLVTGTQKGEILTWNMQNLSSTTNTVHRERVQAIALSKYDKFLVSGGKEGTIIYSDGKMVQQNQFKGHQNCITDICFSESSLKFVSCSDDGQAKVFDFASSKEEVVFKDHRSNVKSCDWHPTKSLIITGSKDQHVKIWDSRASSESARGFQAHNNTVN